MALQAIRGGVYLPRPISSAASGNITVDANSEKAACILQAPKTGTIAKIAWRTGTVTLGDTMDVRLETVDASAFPAVPSGTLWDTNTNGSQIVLLTDDNTWFTTTLTAGASVTKGDKLAVVISLPGSAVGNMQINQRQDAVLSGIPYGLPFTTAWGSASFPLAMALEYDDGSYEPLELLPATTLTSTSFNNTSTPDSIGLRFKVPFPCRVTGAWFLGDTDGDFDVKLVNTSYNQGAGTGILASLSMDKDIRRLDATGVYSVYFTATAELAANTFYRMVIEPSSATNLAVQDIAVNSLALLDTMPGGQNFHRTTAKDPTGDGSWTNYNNVTDGFRYPLMGLIIDGFADDAGVGGGGGGAFTWAG